MKKTNILPSQFYYPEDLETFDAETETGITLRRFYQPTEKCKHKDKKKTYARAYVSLWLCIFVTQYVRMVVERANKVEGTMS